jgi:beta-alanine--pyruvate transaminase
MGQALDRGQQLRNYSAKDKPMRPNNLAAYWMPFTPNRQFKQNPRLLVAARDMHYTTADGRQLLDGIAGLWCCNAGHGRPKITAAVQAQAAEMDFATPFNMSHPKAFELATKLASLSDDLFPHVFFTNSGSESVETALKMALAYQRSIGEGTRTRLIGRERGYHGVNFGGISVGGIVSNRKAFGTMLGGVDHLRHTHDIDRNAFSVGQPKHGAALADDLERLIVLHDASTVAAVIVEPMAGSTGVLLPPVGYLEKLRAICDKYGVLLIFDEVITGFGRLGSPFAFQHFGVTPDLVCIAKGLTNGAVPMGVVYASAKIHEALMTGPEHLTELFHGYTYSGHPLACAAALATLETYADEGLLSRAATLDEYWAKAVHGLRDCPHVIDIRSMGLVAGVELAPSAEGPTKRAYEVFLRCYDQGVLVRQTGETIALTPPLIISESQIDEIVSALRAVLASVA